MKFKKGDLVRRSENAPFRDFGVVEVVGYKKDDSGVVKLKRISKNGKIYYQYVHEEFLKLVKGVYDDKISKLCLLWWKWNWKKGITGDDFAYEFSRLFKEEIDKAFVRFKEVIEG